MSTADSDTVIGSQTEDSKEREVSAASALNLLFRLEFALYEAHHLPKPETKDYWGDLLKPLQENDAAQCKIWEGEVHNVLIFASLFSAVVTTFIIESYKDLRPDPNETTVILLTRIVARLDNVTNGSASPLISDEAIPFSPSSVAVNVFWILSLVVSLTTMLIGIVASQWLREHQHLPAHFSAEETFGLLSMRTKMVEKWGMGTFFSSLPVLLEVALVLFFLGLAEFLRSLGVNQVTIPVIVVISLAFLFLLVTTAIPAFQIFTVRSIRRQFNANVPTPCPYKSPQSRLFHRLVSSTLGNAIVYSASVPVYTAVVSAYSIVILSITRTQSLDISSRFAKWKCTIINIFPADAFRKRWERATAFASSIVNFFCISRWSDVGGVIHLPVAFPDYNPVKARSWIDLDMAWISLRRSYSSQVLLKTKCFFKPNGRFQKRANYGPLYDHLLGIRHILNKYPQHLTIIDSASQCFRDCISMEDMRPGGPKWKIIGPQYYKAVVEVLRPPGTSLISDIVPHHQAAELLYEEALFLLAVNVQPSSLRPEQCRRLLNWVFRAKLQHGQGDIPLLSGTRPYRHRQLAFIFMEDLDNVNTDQQKLGVRCLDSFFEGVAQGRMDWAFHYLFGYDLLNVVAAYNRLSLVSMTPNRRDRIERAAEALGATLRDRSDSQSPLSDENTQAHAFLTAWAIIRDYPLSVSNRDRVRHRPPKGVLKLAEALTGVAYKIESHPDVQPNRSTLGVACKMWNESEEEVLRSINTYICNWERVWYPLSSRCQ
ncbi:hypothetical protein NLJ89_g9926 [Agrocybe chaxingu]|uniref:DUF6535 domain-containing protein n=1 Tax=Agrocybe chaxingu TaxID=84603 RepID=A0A9W8MPE7_9AGAR|nr:hypothetical protein NLJ89_g9926 [Agrocybe chaxingu]